jgi:F420-dependent methylenetetrahydromethanopterin dehydrogenase
MLKRIKELEVLIEDYKNKENACPHCHFYQNSVSLAGSRAITPEPPMCRNSSRDSLEFEKVDFMSPLVCSPEMEEKSWVFLGTVMIAMGSKVMDMDGTTNVFKVVKESVDRIRRQVEKSEEKLTMDFFLGKESMVVENKMDGLSFDPFYANE